MRILALVPARGGSKRVPNKNIRELGGKPLINWSIEAAQGIPEILDILVSTDSLVIADVARAAGALVPWLRPAELSTDTAKSIDVCLHAMDWYETEKCRVDGLLLMQPTSPFRSKHTIQSAIALFQRHGGRAVVAVSMADSHPMWCFQIENERLQPFLNNGGLSMRSQDLPLAYVINGCLYIATPSHLKINHSFFGNDIVPLLVSQHKEALDIDSEWDWEIAEAILQRQLS
jgi:CMP-N,N'-diacetyllegionaminic acid synthase